MTTQEAAVQLGISRARVIQLIRDERLPAVRHGRDWLIYQDDIIAFAQKPRKNGRPAKK